MENDKVSKAKCQSEIAGVKACLSFYANQNSFNKSKDNDKCLDFK